MSEKILENYFGITPDQTIQDGSSIRYKVDNSLYTIMQVTHLEQEALIELYEMSDHMAKYGDNKVSTFVPGVNEKFLVTHENQDYVLMHNYYFPPSRNKNTGRKLAKFHEKGKLIQAPLSGANRLGQWKSYWIKRLEQIEKVYSSVVQDRTGEEFEKLFIKSFPYYLGLCENAIQYITDTELDEDLTFSDMGTIGHQRFHENVWNKQMEIRNPFDWVFDHPSRDIAEWIRDCYFRNVRSFQPDIIQFLRGYESVSPLSAFSWRLIYSRLLFPIHYFTCIEDHYLTSSQWTQKQLEERLNKYLRDARDYERFLGNFYQLAEVSHGHFPVIDWLDPSF